VQQINLWEQIIIEMQRKEEHVLWIGDLNVKIGNDDRGIAGNHSEITHGGKMLRKLIKERDLQVINGTEKCTGLWTRINTRKKDEKSILDYVITSRKMTEKIQSMHIDEGLYVPTRYKSGVAVETDHKPITVVINTGQCKEEDSNQPKQAVRWNLTKEAVIGKYKKETDDSEDMCKTWRGDNSIQKQYDEWEKCLHSILNNTCIRRKKPLTSGETREVRN